MINDCDSLFQYVASLPQNTPMVMDPIIDPPLPIIETLEDSDRKEPDEMTSTHHSHPTTQRESSMPHRLALLDVDQTLLYNQQNMNDALIDALVEEGITEVYLFTNMELSDIRCYGHAGAPYSRMEVINYLSWAGITVRGVITPADPYFQHSDTPSAVDAAFQSLYLPLMQKRVAQGTPLNLIDYASEDTLEFLFAQLEWGRASYALREANQLAAGEIKSITKPGLCLINKETGRPIEPKQFIHHLDDAKTFFITGPDAVENRAHYLLEQKALPAEFTIDISEATYASSDPKGAMMAHILLNSDLIQANTSIYFFDDREDHLRAVTESHARHNRADNVKLHTCRVPTDYAQAMHPSQKTIYQACLRGVMIDAGATATAIREEAQAPIAASFLLRVLAHPATKVVAALFIIAGIAGLVCGGVGLAGIGIGIGLSLLGAAALTGASAGAAVVGAGLGMTGFFASSKLKSGLSVPIHHHTEGMVAASL